MSLDDKRKHYACKENFSVLKSIAPWSLYFKNKFAPSQVRTKYSVQTDIKDKVSIWCGDLTTLEIDAIVNAANNTLLGGGGVDGSIHRSAGPYLKNECATLGGCETGQAKITGGYKLPAKYVIHTVGPVGENSALLESCYNSCFEILIQRNLKSIAFPCISTGVYGYPNESAAHIAIRTTKKFLEINADKIDRVIFCLFLKKDVEIYERLMQSYFPVE